MTGTSNAVSAQHAVNQSHFLRHGHLFHVISIYKRPLATCRSLLHIVPALQLNPQTSYASYHQPAALSDPLAVHLASAVRSSTIWKDFIAACGDLVVRCHSISSSVSVRLGRLRNFVGIVYR